MLAALKMASITIVIKVPVVKAIAGDGRASMLIAGRKIVAILTVKIGAIVVGVSVAGLCTVLAPIAVCR